MSYKTLRFRLVTIASDEELFHVVELVRELSWQSIR
jgi:hypothetical protein